MFSHVTRRHLVAAGLVAPFAVRAATPARRIIEGQHFTGTRPVDDQALEGGTALLAESYTTIRNCTFDNFGNGAIRAAQGGVDGLVIEDCSGSNFYRFFENSTWDGSPATPLTNFVFRRITAQKIDRGMFQIKYTSNKGLIEDCIAMGSDDGGRYCVGFALVESASDIQYRRCESHRFAEVARTATQYWNGDGFSDERTNARIRYHGCIATQNADGGFDTKSADVYLSECKARGNKKNYRLWNTGHLEHCQSETPALRGGTGSTAHFAFQGGEGSRYVLSRPYVRATSASTAPVLLFETTAPVVVDIYNADIKAPGAPLIVVKGPEPVINWYPSRAAQAIVVKSERG